MYSADVLSSVLKCKEAVLFFTEKMFMLHKLCSDMSYRAVGQEFNVHELRIY